MNIDIDYYISSQDFGSDEEQGIIRLYGVTEEGHSVVSHIHGFESYFWADCPRSFETEENREDLKKALNVSFT